MIKLKVVEDSTVASILSNKALVAQLPGVAEAGKPVTLPGGCGACNRPNVGTDYLKVKKVLAGQGPAQMALLREFLGAEKLKFIYKLTGGKIAIVTI